MEQQQVIGYIRVSTDKQDLEKQNHLLLDYAQKHHMFITEFIEVEISSRKNAKARRIMSPLPYPSLEAAWSMICRQIYRRLKHGYQIAGLVRHGILVPR